MTDKEKYKVICTNNLSIPLYARDWWLDCVCGENQWDVLLHYAENNPAETEAAFPFYLPSKGAIIMPDFTQTLGIWFNPDLEDKNYAKNLYRKQKICNDFLSRLPKHTCFLVGFHSSFTDWLPFYWKGYAQTTRYNYVLPDIGNLNKIEKNMNDNIRRNIKKAQNKYHLSVKKDFSVDLFLRINAKTYERQGIKVYQPKILRKLIETARARKQGNIWGAFDDNEQLHAAVFIVWQDSCAYYIAGGGDPALRQSGAHALVLWEVLREVSKVSASFDFYGSMVEGIEHFFRGFGAIQTPYFILSKGKMSIMQRAAKAIKTYLKFD